MGETDIGQLTNTTLNSSIDNFDIGTTDTDGVVEAGKEVEYQNTEWSTYLAYYKECPQLKQACKALSFWTVGKGYTASNADKVALEGITGHGTENIISILMDMIQVSMFARESYAHIIRNDKGTIINLKKLNPGVMKVIYNEEGLIKRYEQTARIGSTKAIKKFKPREIFHLTYDRVADESHGTSITEVVKWFLDAKKEAEADWRRISHRSSIRVMYVDVDDTTRLNTIKTQYATGIKNGELLLIPAKKGEAEFEDLTLPPIEAFMRWIEHLENVFYQQVGVPRVIATSENYTDAGAKTGFLTFEPVYTTLQKILEMEMWNQLAIRIKFNRPPSLSNDLKQDEAKDGPIGFQPSDAQAGAGA
jgi:hypothetical protein